MAGLSRGRKIFISSAQGGLMPYRTAAVEVCRRWGWDPVSMEELTPERASPAEWSESRVKECDAYLLLLGHRYGSLVPDRDISYSELEYVTAAASPDMPILVWTVDPAQPWSPSDIDTGDQKDRLDRFKAKVSTHVRGTFGGLAAFREDVAHALTALERKRHEGQTGNVEKSPIPSAAAVLRPRRVIRAPDPYANPAYVGSLPFAGRKEEITWLNEWRASTDPVAVVEAIGGTGKSALTWAWFQDEGATGPNLGGRFWWSLYNPANTIEEFQRTFLVYASGCSWDDSCGLTPNELEDAVFSALDNANYLLVLDGAERLLNAYHRFDAGTVSEVEVENLRRDHARAVVDPRAYRFLRRLAGLSRSKILISTRLLPDSFIGYGAVLPGVNHLPLRGLAWEDVRSILAQRGIRYNEHDARKFFSRLDNHPLLIGIVIGMVRSYRPQPRDFSAWLRDPTAGGAFSVADLPLMVDRSHHILEQALAGLDGPVLQLLQRLAVPVSAATWEMTRAISPFRMKIADAPEEWKELPPFIREFLQERRLKITQGNDAEGHEFARLDAALAELQDRGLLWWDQESNSYDLHPVVRAYAAETTAAADRTTTNQTLVRDHFGRARPTEDPGAARSSSDLIQTIMFFHALVGAGMLGGAEQLWLDRLREPLVKRLGAHLLVIELLEPLLEFSEFAGVRNNYAIWDLAISLDGVGLHGEAARLNLDNVRNSIAAPAPATYTLSALNNLIATLEGQGALATRYSTLLADLTSAAGNMPGDMARLRLLEAIRSLARDDYEGALASVTLLATGPPNPHSINWDGDIMALRTTALRGLGRLNEIGPITMEVYPFGDNWIAQRDWCDFVWGHALSIGDFPLALEAAHERRRWSGLRGRESLPCDLARALVELGHLDEGRRVLHEALLRFDRVEFHDRPLLDAAHTMRKLGHLDEAQQLALDAYRQAWGDGPPNCSLHQVNEARALLAELGVASPDLPVVDPATVPVPLEAEIRAYIEAVRKGDIPVDWPS